MPTTTASQPTRTIRKPRRLTITVPQNVYDALDTRSTHEGRTMSNLAAYLLEASLQQIEAQ